LDFFKNPNVTIIHKNLLLAYNKAYRIIHEPAGASIILVIGPSGVGKSTLIRLLEKKIFEESLARMEIDPGWIPLVRVEAPAPGRGTFRWKNFYKLILIAVDEPQINQKINYDEEGVRRSRDGKLVVNSTATEDSLRSAMEKALIHRKPYTLAVDEFQHIGKLASEEVLQAHMDCVKSAVNTTKIPWTGLGTYQLLTFLRLTPQLSRRTKVIHFPRYRLEFDEEIKEFKRVLEHFQYRMPLLERPPLKQKYWEFCYERSIGNIGFLKDWLTDAYDLALSEEAKTLTIEHLQETAKLSSECEQMATEALEGEEELTDSKEKSNNLLIILGLKKNEPPKNETEGAAKDSHQQKKKTKSQKNKKPFKRNPKRDSLGG
jgi:energy-coupling factor transporter ATP-binding protein EcfA2